jgi:hypothetical protein
VVRLTVGESTWAVPDSHRLIRPPGLPMETVSIPDSLVTQVSAKIRSAV